LDAPTSNGETKFFAAKCMHAHYARDPDFVSMFTDEATLCTLIRHENVVATIDVTQGTEELLLVLELVEGESLSKLIKSVHQRKDRVPQPIVSAIVRDMLRGLHAAHEAMTPEGEPLLIVHRDVSPHNVLVGTDGMARVLDFGVAKARGRVQQTQKGQLKGKLAYMSPEQARGRMVDRRSDVFSAGIVLWELLTGQRLLDGDNEAALLVALLSEKPAAPGSKDAALAQFDALVQKALEVEPGERYPTALEMAAAVERAIPPASRTQVAEWVKVEAKASLERRKQMMQSASVRVRSLLAGPTSKPGETVQPASGTVVKDEPVGAIDLGWSLPPPAQPSSSAPSGPSSTASAGDAARPAALLTLKPLTDGLPVPTATGALRTVPLAAVASASKAVSPKSTLPLTGAVPPRAPTFGTPNGAPRPRVEPRIAEPRLADKRPAAARGLAATPPQAPRVSEEPNELWDAGTTTDDGAGGASSTERPAPTFGSLQPAPTPLQPAPTQVLPTPLSLGELAPPSSTSEAESLRDATLPLYQPPAAYLEAAGIQLPAAAPSSTGALSGEWPRATARSVPEHVAPSAPGSSAAGPAAGGVLPLTRGSLASIPSPLAQPSAPPRVREGAEGVSSSVSSVNLTTQDIPPPLPDAAVKRLKLVAVISGTVAALACISLLVILSRKPWVASASSKSAVASVSAAPLPAPTSSDPKPQTNPVTTSAPASAAPVEPAPAPSSSATAAASAEVSSVVPSASAPPSSAPTAPVYKPNGFLGRPPSPKPKKR
jgi:serine/threonine-protein kinase